MLVVSDTSPLTALLQIGRIDVPQTVFGRVLIPYAVRDELLREHALLPEWIEVFLPKTIPQSVLAAGLDLGETEAIALALESHADNLLMDERLGRRVAVAHGLRVTGLLGVLVLGKWKGCRHGAASDCGTSIRSRMLV